MTDAPDVVSVPGKPALLLGAFEIADVGYVAEEFFVSGTASSYSPTGELGSDGRWSVTPSDTADYTTRVVVLTPADRTRFNGTVLVEWLNVSGGIDAPALWMMAHREVLRSGYAYVTVSAQKVGVDGGASLLGIDMSLKSQNPQRYAALSHPGDAFSYDIFSQVAGLVRGRLLEGLPIERLIAVGESQSAMFLTSYINAVDPLAKAYDGFLVHSRFGPAAPLDDGSIFDDDTAISTQPVAFRPDLRVPLLAIITETDLFGGLQNGYYYARRSDDDRLRVWEIPGAAHADNYTIQVAPIDTGDAPLDDIVAAYAPTNVLMGQQLEHYINFAPQHHYVVQAAIAALDAWVRTGEPAPAAPPIAMHETEHPRPVLDTNGIAEGGVRTPWDDGPTAPTPGAAATLSRLSPGGVREYVEKFTAALDTTIRSGFILPADRAEILKLAAA